jgi:hypothetical protein
VAAVLAFNAGINGRSLNTLSSLMADHHRFIDTAGMTVEGKAACIDAWRSFFDAYPDYRNHFGKVETDDRGVVVVHGRSDQNAPLRRCMARPTGERSCTRGYWTNGESSSPSRRHPVQE